MMAGGVRILGQEHLLPVTALDFCTISSSVYLLAGEGPRLKVFSRDGELLTHAELLPFQKIHGIRPAPSRRTSGVPVAGDGEYSATVLVFGQKSLRLVTVRSVDSHIRIQCSSAVIGLDDWILDVCWLGRERSGDSSFRVAAVTAHNTVVICTGCEGSGGGDGGAHQSNPATTGLWGTRDVPQYHCEVNCILYSARFLNLGDGGRSLAVASGTVFNEVLLWHLEGERPSHAGGERVRVRLTLTGHEGVIFSLQFSTDCSCLVSVSDDRTVRIWNLPPDWRTMERSKQSSSLVLYGHTARVWDARLLGSRIVSIGEDATCRVWDCQGHCLETVEGHRGRSIWSMAVEEHSGLVATGGGDCSVRMFPLKPPGSEGAWSLDTMLPALAHSAAGEGEGTAEETPRAVLLCGHTALSLTNCGCLYASETLSQRPHPAEETWQLLHYDPELAGYGVVSLSPDQWWLALGSLQGSISIMLLDKNGLSSSCAVKFCAHGGKVFSLTWLGSSPRRGSVLLSCGPDGEMVCWGVQRHDPEGGCPTAHPLAHLSLPPSKHRWVSAATLLPSPPPTESHTPLAESGSSFCWVVCGDRKGSLHLYLTDLQAPENEAAIATLPGEKYLQPMQSLRGIHGPNGVTHVTTRHGRVVTCGRDGYCRQFSLNSDRGLSELAKFKPVKGMDWIERLFYTDTDQLVLGFHTTEMVLYSVGQNRCVMRVSCGGGHRSYGFSSLPELLLTKEATVVYVKRSVICFRVVNLSAHLPTPVLQQAFVGREAVSLQIVHSNSDTGSGVVAVGSEDCTVCLLSLQPSPDGHSLAVRVRRFVQGHISSVRALSTSLSSRPPLQQLLFSGGARASVKVWKVNVGAGSELEVTLEAELSIHHDRSKPARRKKKPSPGADSLLPECRVMALVSFPLSEVTEKNTPEHYVAAGCSDGAIRQYIYNEETRGFSSLGELHFHNRCILTLRSIICSPGHPTEVTGAGAADPGPERRLAAIFLCSAATDGRVAVWQVDLPSLGGEGVGSGSGGAARGGVGPSSEQLSLSPRPVAVCQAHQSGINDMATLQVSDTVYHIATVGDDNALAVLSLTTAPASVPPAHLEVLCSEPSAHSSSITGVSFLSPTLLVTTSIDQRLTVWRVPAQTECRGCGQPALEQVYSHTHDIADVSALKLYHWGQRAVLVMCGVGLQCFVVTKSS